VAQRLAGVEVVGGLAVALDVGVVGAVERRDLGGVRRAAGVLEQRGVEERGARGGVEAELAGDPHADQAGALGMAARLPLGDVECVRERGEHLREPDVHVPDVGPAPGAG
jgi:hypothetical protein